MNRKRLTGSTSSSLLCLLVLLLGLGAWNYHRHYAQEQASRSARPYAGYSTKDVTLLRDAAATDPRHRKLREDLDEELALREDLGAGFALHWTRLTSF